VDDAVVVRRCGLEGKETGLSLQEFAAPVPCLARGLEILKRRALDDRTWRFPCSRRHDWLPR
jgi:hypothetical protein